MQSNREIEASRAYWAAHPRPLPAAAKQQPTTTTAQRAIRDGMSAAALFAVSKWNERRGFDERRRKARARLRDQAAALRAVASDLESVLEQASYGLQEAA